MMKTAISSFLSVIILLFCLAPTLASAAAADSNDQVYLFSYFRGNGDGLHLAYSFDGLKWTPLKNGGIFLRPKVGGKLMRDPSVVQGPDGIFHMVWTSSWSDNGIGIAHSKDLANWSEQTYLPVMAHEPNALNCWAPEIFYDEVGEQYLIYWATSIPGRFPETDQAGHIDNQGRPVNHRIYYVTTKNFKTYSDTALFYDGGFNVIDAFIIKQDGKYIMFVKDETNRPMPQKNIRIATSDRATGPYSKASEPISPNWVEGPSAIKVGDMWYLYYDGYTRHYYEGACSKDLKNWENITNKLSFPRGTRHGTVFRVSKAFFEKLKANIDSSPRPQ